jgi:hypothetical protein
MCVCHWCDALLTYLKQHRVAMAQVLFWGGPAVDSGLYCQHRNLEVSHMHDNCYDACAFRVVQVSPDSGLLQCSTVADLVDFKFADEQVGKWCSSETASTLKG